MNVLRMRMSFSSKLGFMDSFIQNSPTTSVYVVFK